MPDLFRACFRKSRTISCHSKWSRGEITQHLYATLLLNRNRHGNCESSQAEVRNMKSHYLSNKIGRILLVLSFLISVGALSTVSAQGQWPRGRDRDQRDRDRDYRRDRDQDDDRDR